jgi:hypothetical protein
VTKVGDQGRGTYVVGKIIFDLWLCVIDKLMFIFIWEFQKALSGLTKAHIQSFLRERYGSNALRIYNMFEERGCLSQKQVINSIEYDFLILLFLYRLKIWLWSMQKKHNNMFIQCSLMEC